MVSCRKGRMHPLNAACLASGFACFVSGAGTVMATVQMSDQLQRDRGVIAAVVLHAMSAVFCFAACCVAVEQAGAEGRKPLSR